MTQWGLDTLFNPAKRHMDEEKRRLQSTREEVGDNSGGKRIDFETGKVRISKAERADDDDESAPAEDEPAPVAEKPAQSAAAIRAAERRKRKSG
jgi:Family of unknown function (DUF6191)